MKALSSAVNVRRVNTAVDALAPGGKAAPGNSVTEFEVALSLGCAVGDVGEDSETHPANSREPTIIIKIRVFAQQRILY